jgi:hypothetical protein
MIIPIILGEEYKFHHTHLTWTFVAVELQA